MFVSRFQKVITSTFCGLICFFLIVFVGIPEMVGYDSRHSFVGVLIFSALLIIVGRSNAVGSGIAYACLVFVQFAFPLALLWHFGYSDAAILGGILPINDAAGYYRDANDLIQGVPFSEFSSRRPIFPGMLAVFLYLFGNDLRAPLLIFTSINALATCIIGLQIRRIFGPFAAALFIELIFLFYRRYIGTTLTEQLGLVLGLISLYFFINSLVNRKWLFFIFGYFCMLIGLNARAGAFFIIPTIIMWVAFYPHNGLDERLKKTGQLIAITLFGFFLNFLLLYAIGNNVQSGFSNFSYSLYGLTHGGTWTLTLNDYQLNGLSGVELTNKIYSLSLEALVKNPLVFLYSVVRAWIFFFGGYVFSFIIPLGVRSFSEISFITLFLVLIFEVLSIIGFCLFVRDPKINKSVSSFFCFSWLGIFLSVPFLPPWDADRMRVYAVSIPWIMILPSAGVAYVAQLFPIIKQHSLQFFTPYSTHADIESGSHSKFMAVLAGSLLIIAFLSPLVFLRGHQHLSANSQTGRGYWGTVVKIDSDGAKRFSPDVNISNFKNNLRVFTSYYPQAGEKMKVLHNQTMIGYSKGGKTLIITSSNDPMYSVEIQLE